MSDATQQAKEADYLNMSDEDIMNMPPPPAVEETPAEVVDEGETKEGTEDTSTEGTDAGEEAADQAGDDAKEVAEGADEDEEAEETAPEEKPKESTESAVDYEAEYKRILAPFKANGRDVEVKSVEDAISLMQMGANYNKKMSALKPNLKVLKLLENNGLLNEEKLSFLIELDKKNPGAINKLVKDSGIDPMDLDAEKAGEYQPKIHTVDDREMALDTVLDEIQETKSYTRTLGIVSKEWDGASKQVIVDHPQVLKVINDHVERGVYDLISKEVERERTFGRLNGLSDLEAYRQVGDAIQARGGFDHLADPQNKSQNKPVVVTPKPKASDDKLKEKKRAASSSNPGATTSTTADDFNPLALSDEEFAKLADKRFR